MDQRTQGPYTEEGRESQGYWESKKLFAFSVTLVIPSQMLKYLQENSGNRSQKLKQWE